MSRTTCSVAAVVVSYNTRDSLAACIAALRRAQLPPTTTLRVVVVDNASSDGSNASASAADVYIQNDTNRGFGAAANQGFASVTADYYLVLNPDVRCDVDTVSRLIDCFATDNRIAAVGASPRDETGTVTTRGYYRREPTLMQVLLFETSLRRIAKRSKWAVFRWLDVPALASTRSVPQVPGGYMLTSRRVLDQVGGFDEDFFVWFEDVDWSTRARKAGLRLIYCADASVEHVGGESFEAWSPLRQRLVYTASLRTYFRKHMPLRGVVVTVVLLVDALVRAALTPGRGDWRFVRCYLAGQRGRE